ADAMWASLASALRAMARLATLGSRTDDRSNLLARTEELRTTISRDFASAQQSAEESAFELTGSDSESLAARERLQTAAAEAQAAFLTQLAIAHDWAAVAPEKVPLATATSLRHFDGIVADSLDALADRAQRGSDSKLPDLRTPLSAVSIRAPDRVATTAGEK